MNKSQRIYLSTGSTGNNFQDKYVKVKLEQNIETLEFMSLKIGTTEMYQNFNSDYGVLVGRVIANGGVGIPNARISIFIPLSEEDELNDDIRSIYPYKTPRDVNNEGKRYNLLPRVSKINPKTGVSVPNQPFGSFPIKEEVLGNESFLDVYKKYYKYTALTNNAGDYMIFGVPVGVQTVHMSVDITDIGKYSMTPASMVNNLGYSPNLFTDNNSKIKPSKDLDDLPHIETQEITVDVRPFWGDVQNFEIGITRQDFRIRSTLQSQFTIFGSIFTDGDGSMWGANASSGNLLDDGTFIRELYYLTNDKNENIGIASKRSATITERIFYYPPNITDEMINSGNVAEDGSDLIKLDKSEYSSYKRNGDFIYILNCNRNKITNDNLGNSIPVDDDSNIGVFTKFRGFMIVEITPESLPMNFSGSFGKNTKLEPFRYILRFPQGAGRDESFSIPNSNNKEFNKRWRNQVYSFEAGNFYSLAKFHGVVANNNNDDSDQKENAGFLNHDTINYPALRSFNISFESTILYSNVGLIITGNSGEYDPEFDEYEYNNAEYEFPSNATTYVYKSPTASFGANWMNMSIHIPQVGRLVSGQSYVKGLRVTDHFTKQINGNKNFNTHFVHDNTDPIAGGIVNTKFMARSDLHWTDFIHVPVEDIINMRKVSTKGFKSNIYIESNTNNELNIIETEEGSKLLKGSYRNGDTIPNNPTINWVTPCPISGGKKDGIPTNANDKKTYFYKGFDEANCLEFLKEIGIV